MSINIGDKPEMNVVNVGDELTSDQLAALQNAQGASATNPCLTRTNTFNTADTAVRITQEGAGDAFVVEDAASDTTPFRINASGQVGIGQIFGGASLSVQGPVSVVGNSTLTGATNCSTSATTPLTVSVTNTNSAVVGVSVDYRGTGDAVRITNTGTGNSFVVEDDANPDSTQFVVGPNGDVTIGGAAQTTYKFRVAGISQNTASSSSFVSRFDQIGTGGAALFTSTIDSTSDCVRITNLGSGNSFVVEDDTNPDSTPFIINNLGNIGIGRQPTSRKLEVNGNFGLNGLISADTNIAGATESFVFSAINTSNTGNAFVIENRGTGNSLVVRDEASDTTPFVIAADGKVSTGNTLKIMTGQEIGPVNTNNTWVSIGGASGLDATTYTTEIEIVIDGATYRVPARAI